MNAARRWIAMILLLLAPPLLAQGPLTTAATPLNPAVCALPFLQKFIQLAINKTDPATKLQTLHALKLIADKTAKSNPAASQMLLSQLSAIASGTLEPTSPEVTNALALLLMSPEGMRATQLSLRNAEVQRGFFALFDDLHSKNLIRPLLKESAETLKADPAMAAQLGPKAQAVLNNPPLFEAALDEATAMLDAVLKLEKQSPDYWRTLAKTSAARAQKAMTPFKKQIAENTLTFEDPAFQKMFEKELAAKFYASNLTRLSSGAEAKAARSNLIHDADEITMFTWAFYDDATGKEIAADLTRAAKRGTPVRLLVDGQTSIRPGHDALVKELAQQPGIEVIYWKSPDANFPYYGNHRKALVTGKKNSKNKMEHKALVGGRNPGDVYYTTWDDSEVLVEGPAVSSLLKTMEKVWNDAVPTAKAMGSSAKPVSFPLPPRPKRVPKSSSGSISATVDHVPGIQSTNPIYHAHRLAMDAMGPGDEVLIENAYVILDPGFYRSILAAQRRGAKVTVLTNSLQSVDEPIVANPIAKSASHLATAQINQMTPAEVFVKQGDKLTDHTKVSVFIKNRPNQPPSGMVIDMSHNHHPRSLRLEGEVALITIGSDASQAAAKMIRERIKAATKVTEPIQTAGNPLVDELITRMGFYELL